MATSIRRSKSLAVSVERRAMCRVEARFVALLLFFDRCSFSIVMVDEVPLLTNVIGMPLFTSKISIVV